MAAPLGNTNGKRGTRWRDALNKALAQYTREDVQSGEALDQIAQNVVHSALNGEWDCIQEIANRLDGKAAQAITVGGDEDSPLQHQHHVIFVNGTDRASGKA